MVGVAANRRIRLQRKNKSRKREKVKSVLDQAGIVSIGRRKQSQPLERDQMDDLNAPQKFCKEYEEAGWRSDS